jgi:hypothetical protein
VEVERKEDVSARALPVLRAATDDLPAVELRLGARDETDRRRSPGSS